VVSVPKPVQVPHDAPSSHSDYHSDEVLIASPRQSKLKAGDVIKAVMPLLGGKVRAALCDRGANGNGNGRIKW
jgi:hypothetical protein